MFVYYFPFYFDVNKKLFYCFLPSNYFLFPKYISFIHKVVGNGMVYFVQFQRVLINKMKG